jgi:hypothetical protein
VGTVAREKRESLCVSRCRIFLGILRLIAQAARVFFEVFRSDSRRVSATPLGRTKRRAFRRMS